MSQQQPYLWQIDKGSPYKPADCAALQDLAGSADRKRYGERSASTYAELLH